MMNRMTTLMLAAGLAFAATFEIAYGQGQGGPQPGVLDSSEEATLVLMREEEKLARDVYLTLQSTWDKPVFANIADSEQRHMDTMLKMLDLYGVADPVVSDAVGDFSESGGFGPLYLDLVAEGEVSLLDALLVGAWIEESDILILSAAIEETDEPPLDNAYGNLLAASMNHLRTFVSHIMALGVPYEAQVMTPAQLVVIVGDTTVPPPQEGFTINGNMSDAWYYPDTDGQGFFISVFPDQRKICLAWFTYDTELPGPDATAVLGDPGQRWLTAQGSYAGAQAELQVYSSSGGLFDASPPAPVHDEVGSLLLQFEDCAHGSVTYELPGVGSGVIPIERVAPDNVTHCERSQQPSR